MAIADALLPLKIAGGILLGYILFEFWQSKLWPPNDPDGWV